MKELIFAAVFFPLVALGFAARLLAEAAGLGWRLAEELLRAVFE